MIVYLDFKGIEQYILWHAPNAQQFNFDDPADLNHMLFNLGLEVPDQLDRVLSKKFRPQEPGVREIVWEKVLDASRTPPAPAAAISPAGVTAWSSHSSPARRTVRTKHRPSRSRES